jgi:uncharacterized Ntn-hydrolase superfamily protein
VARVRDPRLFGLIIASSSPAVAARCAHARAGVGAVASQNITDPRLGGRGLDLMASGLSASAARDALCREAPHIAFRQLALVDRHGGSAVFCGERALGVVAARAGDGVAVAGNLLASPAVPDAMLDRFAAMADAPLGDRLIAAMLAGVAAGGEAGPVRSAGLLLADRVEWPVADLRIDWADAPITALAALWEVWKPQMDAYVTRALDPAAAPAFGVAGDR